MNENPWSWRNVNQSEMVIVKIIVDKLPIDCNPMNCRFAHITNKGQLFCTVSDDGSQWIREVKKSKNFTTPINFCKLEVNHD